MQPKKITRTIENISKRKLSIQFSLDGFSFCISNFEDTIFNFTTYTLPDTIKSPESLLDEIHKIFQKDKDLQDDFESVTVIHENNLNTLVPSPFFEETELKSYLDYNIRTLSTDFIAYDDLENLRVKNVYVPYVNINNFLFQNFGEFEYKHHLTQLIEKLKQISSDESIHVYVHVGKSRFDMIVFDGNQLLFSNCFEYETKEDFLYYILFTYEQLQLDPNKEVLHLMGEIHKDSELYQIAYKYIRDLKFVNTHAKILQNSELELHSNYILLG